MTKTTFLIVVMLVCLEVSAALAAVSFGRSYDSRTMYAGPFGAQVLYYRNPGSQFWQRGLNKELNAVSCRSAMNNFRTSGMWQGHLKPDGSCADPSEPVEWAVGNRLNFDGVPAARKR